MSNTTKDSKTTAREQSRGKGGQSTQRDPDAGQRVEKPMPPTPAEKGHTGPGGEKQGHGQSGGGFA